MLIEKQMVPPPPTAQARGLLQLFDTPIVTDVPSPAEILHGRSAQGAVFQDIQNKSIWDRFAIQLMEIQNAQKEQFDRSDRAKDPRVIHRCNPQAERQSLQEKQSAFITHLLRRHQIPDPYKSKRG